MSVFDCVQSIKVPAAKLVACPPPEDAANKDSAHVAALV